LGLNPDQKTLNLLLPLAHTAGLTLVEPIFAHFPQESTRSRCRLYQQISVIIQVEITSTTLCNLLPTNDDNLFWAVYRLFFLGLCDTLNILHKKPPDGDEDVRNENHVFYDMMALKSCKCQNRRFAVKHTPAISRY
jgi:hypothetical protein